MNHPIGSENLSIHLEKNCSSCIDSLRNDMDNLEEGQVTDPENIEPPAPIFNFSAIEKIEEIIPALEEQTFMSEEWKKNRRIKLFNDRSFHAKYLIKKKENGTYDYEKMIKYIHFLEECRKDLAAIHQAYDLAKRWHIENENLEARAKIKEEDQKYKSNYKEREEKEKTKSAGSKMSPNEKKIAGLVKLGISEDKAKEIILGKS